MPDQYSARERAAAEAMERLTWRPIEALLPLARVALRAADEVEEKGG